MDTAYFDTLPTWTAARWSDDATQLLNAAEGPLWSGKGFEPPAVGARTRVTVNGLGPGTVLRYFTQSYWLGVLVKLDNPPEWYVKRNGKDAPCHAFGMELAPVDPRGNVRLVWSPPPSGGIMGPHAKLTGGYVYEVRDGMGRKLMGGTTGPDLVEATAYARRMAAEKGLPEAVVEVVSKG